MEDSEKAKPAEIEAAVPALLDRKGWLMLIGMILLILQAAVVGFAAVITYVHPCGALSPKSFGEWAAFCSLCLASAAGINAAVGYLLKIAVDMATCAKYQPFLDAAKEVNAARAEREASTAALARWTPEYSLRFFVDDGIYTISRPGKLRLRIAVLNLGPLRLAAQNLRFARTTVDGVSVDKVEVELQRINVPPEAADGYNAPAFRVTVAMPTKPGGYSVVELSGGEVDVYCYGSEEVHPVALRPRLRAVVEHEYPASRVTPG